MFDYDFVGGYGPKGLTMENSQLNTYPHQFSLQDRSSGNHLCSATLVHPFLLLTAAHCVFGRSLGGLKVVPGNDYYQQMGHTGQELSLGIREAILHSDFDATTLNGDIALLRVDQRVAHSNGGGLSSIVRLPQPNWVLREEATVTGWGLDARSSSGAPSTGAFETIGTNIADQSYCREEYESDANKWNRTLTNKMLCAGYSGDGSCKEIESGAVLMCEKEGGGPGKLFICGIGSWGYGCGTEVAPMVYTDVRKYRSWISKEMRKIWTRY